MAVMFGHSSRRPLRPLFTLTAFFTAAASLHAASPAEPTAPATAPGLFAASAPPLDVATGLRYETPGFSTSTDLASEADPLSADPSSTSSDGAAALVGQHRRSYGRSRYEDRMHNRDGSSKIAFMGGAGANFPVGNTAKFYSPSYDFAVGAGWNWSRMFGILGEFHYDRMSLTDGAKQVEYNNLLNYVESIGGTADDLSGFDANAHILSISVDPVVSFASERSRFGAYLTGGVGYYKKTTNFTLPAISEACNSFFCQSYYSNYNIDSASANSFGANGGFGFTYKLSEFSSERLFAEARYHWLKIDGSNNNDFFPFNRRNSEIVPFTVGLRF